MATAAKGIMGESAEQGFSDFYEEWFDRVYNYARHRTGSPTRADEIVSDVFSRALSSWSAFDPLKGDRRTWLFSIAFRSIADHYRAEKRRRWLSLGLLSGPKEPCAPPGGSPEADEERGRLMAALDGLSSEQREIVSLKFFGGMTNRAIAGLLGLTEGNVAIIIFRCVRRMRKCFEGGEACHG